MSKDTYTRVSGPDGLRPLSGSRFKAFLQGVNAMRLDSNVQIRLAYDAEPYVRNANDHFNQAGAYVKESAKRVLPHK